VGNVAEANSKRTKISGAERLEIIIKNPEAGQTWNGFHDEIVR